jgi:hypothetical protein
MKVFTKLGLLVGLVVAVIGAAPASAFGTTITSEGSAYNGPFDIDGIGATFIWESDMMATCGNFDISGMIASDGTGQITSWTFGMCTDSFSEPVLIRARDLPYDVEVEHTSGNDGTLTITSPIKFRISGWASLLGGCELTAAAGATAAEVTGSAFGSNAEVDVPDPGQPLSSGSWGPPCTPGDAIWTAEAEFLTPDQLRVAP